MSPCIKYNSARSSWCTNRLRRGPVWTKNKHFSVRSSVKPFYTASEKGISSIEKISWPKIFKLHTSTSGGFWRPEGPKSLVAAGITGPVVVWRISCFHCVHSLSFVLSPPNQDSTGGKPESSILSALSCNCEMRCTTDVSRIFLRQVIPLPSVLIDRPCWPKTYILLQAIWGLLAFRNHHWLRYVAWKFSVRKFFQY